MSGSNAGKYSGTHSPAQPTSGHPGAGARRNSKGTTKIIQSHAYQKPNAGKVTKER